MPIKQESLVNNAIQLVFDFHGKTSQKHWCKDLNYPKGSHGQPYRYGKHDEGQSALTK